VEKAYEETESSYEIRVKLKNVSKIDLVLRSDIEITDQITGSYLIRNRMAKTVKIDSDHNQTRIDGRVAEKPFYIRSKVNREIRLNNRIYMGYLRIIPGESGFEVINHLPIEMYLISVLPSEVPASFETEALKAQAVIARTYAYYFMKKSEERDFDVDDTVSYQVFKGYQLDLTAGLFKKVSNAVFSTRSQILVFEDEPVIAYFHANSGGKTVSGKEYFGKKSDLPYLISQDDPYSLDKKSSTWTFDLPVSDFKRVTGLDVSSDTFKVVLKENGWVDTVVSGSQELTAKDIRKMIGTVKIKSERFIIKLNDAKENILFSGIGYGHGVGLSQWGAQGMALLGNDYQKILQFYYPGTRLIQIR
jgi:stage II sporulation protein D